MNSGAFLGSMFAPVTQLEEADDSAYCGRGHYGGRGRGAPTLSLFGADRLLASSSAFSNTVFV